MTLTQRPVSGGVIQQMPMMQADPRGLNVMPRPLLNQLGEIREGKSFRFQNTKLPVEYEDLYHDGEFDHQKAKY